MDNNPLDNSSSHEEDDVIVDAEFEEVAQAPVSETALVRSSSVALTQYDETRLGCAYCFNTLDPHDSDETLRRAVRIADRYYHQVCWEKAPEAGLAAEEFTPPAPHPVRVARLRGIPLYAGLVNKITDTPLGISESLITFNTTDGALVKLRNNSAHPLPLDCRRMPLWVYAKYPSRLFSHEVQLAPEESICVELYPHLVRPGDQRQFLSLAENQGIYVESQSMGLVPVAMLVGVYALWLWHVSAFINLRYWFYYWDTYANVAFHFQIAPLLTLFALLLVLTLLAPAAVVWGIYTAAHTIKQSPAGSVLAPLTDRVEGFALWMINTGLLQVTQTRWVMPVSIILVGIAAAGALLVWLLLLLLTTVLMPLSDLFYMAEAALLLYLLYRFGLGYGFNLVAFINSGVRYTQAQYRAGMKSPTETES